MTVTKVDTSVLHANIDALRTEDLRQRRTMKWSEVDPDVLAAWVAEMDYPLAPVVDQAVRATLDRGGLGYPRAQEFVSAFTEWAWNSYRWRVDPAHVAPVGDVMAGIESALRTLLEPGDGVALFTPAYPPFLTLLDELRLPVRECRLRDTERGWRMDLDAVSDALGRGARAVLLCHPHNPTGRVWSVDELHALAELVEHHGAHVISDEIHAPLTAEDERFVPYAASGPAAAAHTVTLSSVSKGWNVPGLKCAVMVTQGETGHVADAVSLHHRLRASAPGIATASALWHDDGGWLSGIRSYVSRTREALRSWVEARPNIHWHPGEAGYLAWLDLRETGLGPDPATVLLEQARVRVNPGIDFAPAPSSAGHGHVRLNHATSLPILASILDRLDRIPQLRA